MKKINLVCIIDDDSIVHFMLSKIIELSNQVKNIIHFYNGQEALNFLIEKANDVHTLPDIIFLDVNMPVMSGWEFLDEYTKLKSSFKKNILIYVLSSSNNMKDLTAAKQVSDIKEYIIKPLSVQKLNNIFKTY